MTDPEQLTIGLERGAGLYRLTLLGELDIATTETLQEAFDAACAEAEPDTIVVVDLTELEFMDSSGIAALISISRRLPERLRIVNGSVQVQRILDLTGVRPALPIINKNDDPRAPLPS
ncbi:MAG TPA: STAS domain-containing protein [Solirubrobacteraceae bacterium]|jgi:anti-anti-sigma factor